MTQRYFVNETGQYLGSYDGPDGEMPDGLSIGEEVSHAPEHASQVWDFDGEEFLPHSTVPDSVTARQFKLQLVASGLIDAVDAWIATQSRSVQVAYEYSGSFVRNEPMMAAGFQAMGFSIAETDAFFLAASNL